MPPQQIANVSPPSPPGQYDFIVNYNHRPGANWLLQASMKTRIMIFAGGLLVLVLVAWIFIALLTASGNASAQNLTALAAEQAELARISQDPAQNATTEATQDLASTLRLSLLTDEQTFVGYLNSVNAGPSADTLAQDLNHQTDAQLTSAKSSGTFDQTYASIAQQQLASYSSNLKHTFDSTSNATERQLLNTAYTHAQLLIALAS